MACDRYRETLTDLAAGGPAPAELEAHLVTCAACREELETLRHALGAADAELQYLGAAEPSPELAVRIRQAAFKPDVAARVGLVWLWPAVAAAALLVAVAMGMRRPVTQPLVTLASPSPALAPGTPSREVPPAALPVAPPRIAVSPRAPATSRQGAPPEPQVLVPPGGAEALVRLVARLDRERLAPPVMGASGQPSPDLAVPGSIDIGSVDIQPLEIVPLDPAESSGT